MSCLEGMSDNMSAVGLEEGWTLTELMEGCS